MVVCALGTLGTGGDAVFSAHGAHGIGQVPVMSAPGTRRTGENSVISAHCTREIGQDPVMLAPCTRRTGENSGMSAFGTLGTLGTGEGSVISPRTMHSNCTLGSREDSNISSSWYPPPLGLAKSQSLQLLQQYYPTLGMAKTNISALGTLGTGEGSVMSVPGTLWTRFSKTVGVTKWHADDL